MLNRLVYQGSKNRLAKDLVPIIQKYIDDNNITRYIEPMVGGANLIDKIKCEHRIGYDVNENLIALLKWAQKDDEIHKVSEECSFDLYKTVRENQYTRLYPKEYVALIGFCASYGGRYFDGGYGRDRTGKRNIFKERFDNLKEQIPLF